MTGCSVQVDPRRFAAADPAARLVDNALEGRAARRAAALCRPARFRRAADRPSAADPLGGRDRGRRRRPRGGRADPRLRQGPGRLLVLLHLLHHPARPWRRAIAAARGRARRRPPRARRRPSRDRADRASTSARTTAAGPSGDPAARTPRCADAGRASSGGSSPRRTVERLRLSLDRAAARRRRAARGLGRAGAPRCLPHFHLPLQSGDDGVLRRMGRRYDTRVVRAAGRARPRGHPGRRHPRRRDRRLPDRGRRGLGAIARVHRVARVRRPPRLPLLRPAGHAGHADGGPGRRADEEAPGGASSSPLPPRPGPRVRPPGSGRTREVLFETAPRRTAAGSAMPRTTSSSPGPGVRAGAPLENVIARVRRSVGVDRGRSADRTNGTVIDAGLGPCLTTACSAGSWRDGPLDQGPRGRPGRRVPRHRAAGADPRPRHARATTSPPPPTSATDRPAPRPPVRASRPSWRRPRGSPTTAIGSSRTSGAEAARRSTTSTSTCSAGGGSSGRPADGAARLTASIAALIVLAVPSGSRRCGGRAELPATPRPVMSAGTRRGDLGARSR